jgi:hypothetical protein
MSFGCIRVPVSFDERQQENYALKNEINSAVVALTTVVFVSVAAGVE